MIARAAPFSASEVAAAAHGRLDGPDRDLRGVATDTRDPLEGALFVALVGRRFDAHEFLRVAAERGAAALLVEPARFAAIGGRSRVGGGVSVIEVEDTLTGLQALAKAHRRRLRTPVLALTGSNGKTSTKEMLASILGRQGRVLATEGNLNNLVGLPLTLLGLEPEHEICVAEMGMNQLGEIARMAQIAEPAYGLVTNVGPAHIGELGSLENIARAKGELFFGLGGGLGIVNLDDERVVEQARAANVAFRSFGTHPAADVVLLGCEPAETHGQRIALSVDGERLEIHLPWPGEHQAKNAAAAAAAATAAGASPDAVCQGLERLGPLTGRGTVKAIGSVTVIDDSYNANAGSARAAAAMARKVAGDRRLVVAFGQMAELGEFSDAEHRAVGEALAKAGAAVVAAFGPLCGPLCAPLAGADVKHEPEDFDALADWLIERLEPGDVLLVKGSRRSGMERVIRRLEGVR